jgi:hypothetical protein
LNQSLDASWRQFVSVTAHAILQATGFQTPLAAKSPIILCAFPFAGLSHAGRTKNQGNGNQQYCAIIPHRRPSNAFRFKAAHHGEVTNQGQVKATARAKYWLYWLPSLALASWRRVNFRP